MIVKVKADTPNNRRVVASILRLRDGTSSGGSGSAEGIGPLKLFTRIGIVVLRWVDQNFRSGGGKVGGWAPLRPLTLFAKRIGKGAGGPVPLAGLQKTFTYKATDTDVRIGTPSIIAKYQSEGTGPYDIYPRTKKALAFLAPPQGIYSMGVGFYAQRAVIGKKRAAAPRATGIPRAGLAAPGQIRGMGYKVPGGKGPIQTFAVLRHVHHPGLPSRRILPTADETAPIVQAVIQDYLRELRRTTVQEAVGELSGGDTE